MKKSLAALIMISFVCGMPLFISIPVSASGNTESVITDGRNTTNIDSGGGPYAILQTLKVVKTPSGWVTLNCSYGYHDYYKTIAGINYVHIDNWFISRINGTPWVSYYNATSHIVITVTYQRKSDFNYVSETITIYP